MNFQNRLFQASSLRKLHILNALSFSKNYTFEIHSEKKTDLAQIFQWLSLYYSMKLK